MKKSVSLLLAIILCLSFVGCAGAKYESVPVQIDYDAAVVSYLGPEGTYTQEACGVFFDKRGEYIPYVTVQEAVKALVAGESNYAVIPQENTIGGAVIDYVDTLIANTEVYVVGEVELPINQNLLTYPGTEPGDIKTVYSHAQGITQGKKWLEENLPNAEVIEVSSTAEGAKMVAEAKETAYAAIASAACADVYGLDILAEGIQNNTSNKTRFYVLTKDAPATAEYERLAFIAMGSADTLPELLAGMNKEKMTLITLHDRPLKTELGEYYYLIECADSSYGDYLKITENSEFEFRYLGSYNAK